MANPSVEELLARIRNAPPRCGATRVVLIDGRAGAGKSTLANRLVTALGGEASGGAGTYRPDAAPPADAPIQLLHGDDLYEGWDGLATLADVLLDQVLEPLAQGGDGAFRMWDWVQNRRSHTIAVPQRQYLLIEGVGVALPRARELAVLTVFVDAPWSTRLARGVARDAYAYDDVVARWEAFEVEEQAHHARTGAREAADFVIDGTAPVDE